MEVTSFIPTSYPVDPDISWMGEACLLITAIIQPSGKLVPSGGSICRVPCIRDSFSDLGNWPVIKCCFPQHRDTRT